MVLKFEHQKEFFELIRPWKKEIAKLIFFMLLAAMGEAIGLSAIVPVLSIVIEGNTSDSGAALLFQPLLRALPQANPVTLVLGGFVFLILLKSLLQIYSRHLSSALSWKMNETWSNEVTERYLKSPFSVLLNLKQGALVHNIVQETYIAAKAIGLIIEFASKLILSLFLLAALLWTDWKVTLTFVSIGMVILAATRPITKAKSKKVAAEHLALQKELSSVASESMATVRLIKTFSLEAPTLRRIESINRRIQDIRTRFDFLNTLPGPIAETLLIVGIALTVIFVSEANKGKIRDFIPVVGMVVLVGRQLLNNLSLMVGHWMRIEFMLPSALVIHKVIRHSEEEKHQDSGEVFRQLETDIIFKNIHFTYDDGKKVFHGMNLTFPRGKMTAIIGPSGSGKSTIGDLLLGLVQPQEGQILINGKPLPTYQKSSWRKKLGFVSQETIVFHSSVLDNITCNDKSISEARAVEAAKAAQIHDLIESLPEKYHTVLGERGMKVSGGQRQRIAIARAIARDPELFVFDEATSALDTESEKLVQESIDKLSRGNKTVIVITHRKSTIQNADLVYDLGALNQAQP